MWLYRNRWKLCEMGQWIRLVVMNTFIPFHRCLNVSEMFFIGYTTNTKIGHDVCRLLWCTPQSNIYVGQDVNLEHTRILSDTICFSLVIFLDELVPFKPVLVVNFRSSHCVNSLLSLVFFIVLKRTMYQSFMYLGR